jgi:hypothetical protein
MPPETSRNYLQVLKDNKTFERMVDAYLFAAAFAIKEDFSIYRNQSQTIDKI